MNVPRNEYPRPQFVRREWLCLNGQWQFEIDHADTGLQRGMLQRDLEGEITVPFCPESPLGGVEHVDFMNAVWYRRQVPIPQEWADRNVLLHFQAVDYDATVWADGHEVGRHRGGFSPFTCDLSAVARGGQTVTLVVRARDPKSAPKPGGKQSTRYANHGCHYTRTTGIWQTVWMEPVAESYLLRPRLTPDLSAGTIRMQQPVAGNRPGLSIRATLSDDAGEIVAVTADTDADFTPHLDLPIPSERRRPWSPDDPFLYDLQIELLDADAAAIDRASSYVGLRSVTIDRKAVRINGEGVFQRLVLDQGYYPQGVMTAPTDAALRRDIELSMEAGFNGARLHQKVFEERFLYHADRLGYLVWGEFGDWGLPRDDPPATCITQWLEVLGRDYNHPSIVGWCPLNETAQILTDQITPLDDLIRGLYLATKAFDTTRPVLDSSGYSHRIADVDVYDSHDYTQDPELLRRRHAGLAAGQPFVNTRDDRPISTAYAGQPYFVSEFGGIWWNPEAAEDEDSWGYGERPKTIEEFHDRFERLCGILLNDPDMFGYCYTQLTDVYQEQNGIYYFDRRVKFDLSRLRAAQGVRHSGGDDLT